jgi:hypothetical protein
MGVIALPELPWRKFAGAIAVAILHIAIVVILLNSTIVRRIFKPEPKETILYLQPLAKPEPKPQVKRIAPPARRIAPAVVPQGRTIRAVPQTSGQTSGAPAALGYQLYDCRAANLPKLTPEQRAACAKAQVGPKEDKGDAVDFADHSDQVPGAERWAREKARKNGPTLLPCASNLAPTVGVGTLLCLANGAINGFDMDKQAQYGDRPKETHVPNNGDPPPPYTDPDH